MVTKIFSKISAKFDTKNIHFFIIIAFLIWIKLFYGFISGKFALISDAQAYLEHFDFFIENITKGVFPMWEATRGQGIPVEFFLRRIGAYNPTYILVVIFNKLLGLNMSLSYRLFVTAYYFLGMIGFYLISKRVLKNKTVAFVAMLLLMFSSLGTRIFDSFIIFTFTPMVWFFYFLVSFFNVDDVTDKREWLKYCFLGMIFTAMILLTTYIPFYFFMIFLLLILFFFLFFPKSIKPVAMKLIRFVGNNKILFIISLLCVAIALVPGIFFFIETSKGELILHERHAAAEEEYVEELRKKSGTYIPVAARDVEVGRKVISTGNELAVGIDTRAYWGIEEDLIYSSAFTNLKDFKFAIFYVPIFAYMIMLLGIFLRTTKKLLFFFVWGCGTFFLFSHYAPAYEFLNTYIFFFKYFRNLHFFLWLILLPIFILFISELFHQFLKYVSRLKGTKIWHYGFVLLLHIGAIYFIFNSGEAIISSYINVGLSCLFFILVLAGKLDEKKRLFFLVLIILVVSQPTEVYNFLNKNVGHSDAYYRYSRQKVKDYYKIKIPDSEQVQRIGKELKLELQREREDGKTYWSYVDTLWVNRLFKKVNFSIVERYNIKGKLFVYDAAQWLDDTTLNKSEIALIEQYFLDSKNVVFVADKKAVNPPTSSRQNPETFSDEFEYITQDSKKVKVVEVGVNHLTLKTHFESWKCLVYNDSYHSRWNAYIDDVQTNLFRANVAFKGVWVPPGEHIVEYRFGQRWQYLLNYLFLGIFNVVFYALLYLGIKHYLRKKRFSGNAA